MKFQWNTKAFMSFMVFYMHCIFSGIAQYGGGDGNSISAALPPTAETCNGIFISYEFIIRTKEYPHLKNATAQSWAFNATVTVLNTGTVELDGWKLYIGFQHREILVAAGGAVLVDSGDFPVDVSNGTYLTGYPQTDLKTSIDTAGDLTQIQALVQLSGTMFGVKPPGVPMPKTIELVNDGFKCPAPTKKKTTMYACCARDKKQKAPVNKTKFVPRQKGDLLISYDITQAYSQNYLAQVTIENKSPLGRLDHWNLTWEWMRGEFIYTMKGAYTRLIDYSDCIYGNAAEVYSQMDFSKVMNCQKNPIISDLPHDRANDTQVGKIPYCCRNGSILPIQMDPSQSKSVFQLQVYKLPPDVEVTSIYPPHKWKIIGDLNPDYKCGAPLHVSPTEFPDPSGLQAFTVSIASWQIVCNITAPQKRSSKCCVSFSAYYNTSVIPCDTCACGCQNITNHCNHNAPAMLLPPEALLVPFSNRTQKAIAWADLKHFHEPKPLPCPDNCGVSINWHISSNYKNGWTARVTLFNWQEQPFVNWFTAIQLKRASHGYEKAYSFNGTFLKNLNNTVFLQGLEGLNYLMGEANDTKSHLKVPGKQQSVISFTKKNIPGLNIAKGDGFPSRVLFNGEECAIPSRIPTGTGSNCVGVNFLQLLLIPLLVSLLFFQN